METGDTAFPSDNVSTQSTKVDVNSSVLFDYDNIASSPVDASSQQTIDMSTSRWLSCMKCSPGFHDESFAAFAERLSAII